MGIIGFFVLCLVLLVWAAATWRVGWLIFALIMLVGYEVDTHDKSRQAGSAESYREAQRAVARATGNPCDYACKAMIADQAR